MPTAWTTIASPPPSSSTATGRRLTPSVDRIATWGWWMIGAEIIVPDGPGFVIVNSQGRYLRVGDGLRGADRSDALVRTLEALNPEGLADAVRRGRVGAG